MKIHQKVLILISLIAMGFLSIPLALHLQRFHKLNVSDELLGFTNNNFFLIIFLFVLLLFITWLALWKLVFHPLKLISESLDKNNPALLKPLCNSNNEFGRLAELVHSFFVQKNELLTEISERARFEEALRIRTEEATYNLREIQCLYYISNLISLHSNKISDTLFFNIIHLIPHALRYPEQASVYFWLGDKEYNTKDFKNSDICLTRDIRVNNGTMGMLQVFYQPGNGISKESNFNEHETKLISSVAEQLTALVFGYISQINHSKLIKAVEQSPVSVIITDPRGNIEYANPKFINLTGYSMEDVIGKNPRLLKSDYHTETYYKELWETITAGKVWTGEFCNIKKNGEKFWEQASISPIFNEDADIINFVAVKEDITLRKEMEKKLKETMDAKSRFLAVASHELRTPLTAIKEGISIVVEGEAGPINSDQKDFLDTAKRNVDRLHRLINDVLDFTKLESGKTEFHFSSNDINKAVEDVLNIQKNSANTKGLFLSKQLDNNIGLTTFDNDKIIQVMTNLVNNAIKFTEKGGITILTEKDTNSNSIRVTIQDTGTGIAEEDIPKLFVEFQQVGAGRKKSGSSGLGLAICREIIHGHKGKIWIESEIGSGTKFIFTLPGS